MCLALSQGANVAYVPVQRGDILVARDVMAPLSDTMPQHELCGASIAVLVEVPYPSGGVAGSAERDTAG